jgi:hypothetical protein
MGTWVVINAHWYQQASVLTNQNHTKHGNPLGSPPGQGVVRPNSFKSVEWQVSAVERGKAAFSLLGPCLTASGGCVRAVIRRGA